MAGRLVEEAAAIDHRAAFHVLRPKHQPADARMADRPGAHGAGLQGDHQGQASEAIVAAFFRRGAQGQDLGVGGGVVAADGGVMGGGDHLAGRRIDDDGANGCFAGVSGGLRVVERDAHGAAIMVEHSSHPNRPSPAGQADADDGAAHDASDDGQAGAQDGERIAKVLARAGVASRREVERFIEAGRVRLNGEVLTTPGVKIAPGDIVQVDGKVVDEPEPARVWRYHKPVGLLTSHFDPKGRPTVFDALPKDLPRVISVGRLDLNSEGLLLLTNDGGLARALELPSAGLPRRYRARARGRVTQERLDKLKDGITVEGVHYGPIEARLDKAKEEATGANLWITLTLTEGKNREVRKVLEALGLTVNRLIRLAYGPFQLGTLAAGEVEEVGPRVIREQLADHIAPENMPTGTRTPAPVSSAPKPKSRAFKDTAEAEKPKVYKEGWARPVHKPNPHRTGAKRFKPKAEPTVISARPLPAKRDGAPAPRGPAARGPTSRGDDRKSGGKPGGKPFRGDRKPSTAGAPDRKWFDAPKPRDGEPAKPRSDDKPAKPSGFSGQPYAGSNPRAAAKPASKPYGAPRAADKPGGPPRSGGKPFAGKPFAGKPFAGKPGGKPTGRR